MASDGRFFHQSVWPVTFVQSESQYDQRHPADRSENDTSDHTYPDHVHHDEDNEEQKQPACEHEKVLCGQSSKFRRTSYAFVDTVLCHYRKNERRIVAATIKKIQAPNQLAAVLEVSGSPDENFW